MPASLMGFFLLLFLSWVSSHSAHAQELGLSAILNPEGSRLFPQPFVFPRHPGKPDPRWKSFDWRYIDLTIQSAKLRLYFYKEEYASAGLVIPMLKEQVAQLEKKFNYIPTQKFAYLLFGSQRDFQQAHIFSISEGVQGITNTEEATMGIPYWGQAEAFNHISTHELVHQFQIQKVNDLRDMAYDNPLPLIPLWFIEGMAEYYSLGGNDPESHAFIRDLIAYPDSKINYEIPALFEDGALDFVHIYKVGQAKMDFFEKEFGVGTIQRLLETSAQKLIVKYENFQKLVEHELSESKESLEKKWRKYLNQVYQAESNHLSESINDFDVLGEAGENLDLFEISPDGAWIVTREIDPLIGTVSLQLYDLKNGKKKREVAHDSQPGLLSLHFMQFPIIALSNHKMAYVVGTTSGPELEIREFKREDSGELKLGNAHRVKLHEYGFNQVTSPAFSPDEKSVAFVGSVPMSRENVYRIQVGEMESSVLPKIEQLTHENYSWQTLSWSPSGIYGSSDRTSSGKYGLFKIDPESKEISPLIAASRDLLYPEEKNGEMVFQSWQKGSAQIYSFSKEKEWQWTDVKTELIHPRIRNGTLYVLGLKSGRFHIFQIPRERLALQEAAGMLPGEPWKVQMESPSPVKVGNYKPFVSSGVRVDNLSGFFGGGSVGGVAASVSDLMRNYSLSGEIAVLGGVKRTNAYLFLSSYEGRATWITGLYHLSQIRLDSLFMTDHETRTYIHQEFGPLGAVQYPLTAFAYIDLELRIAGVKRSEFSDPTLQPQWNAQNPGLEFMTAPVFRVGYDRILYEAFAGPIKGYGVLIESDTSYFPGRGSVSERLRLDASYYLQLFGGRTVLGFQGLAGASWGGSFRNPFFVSSDDILRAYRFGDNRLLGNYVLATQSEFRFPIGTFFGFPPLRGLLAYDIGNVFKQPNQARIGVTSSTTAGLSLNLPPLAINFLLSYPIRTAPGPVDQPIFHFTLRYLYI